MSFIRVTLKADGSKVELNINHVTHFSGASSGEGSTIILANRDYLEVTDTIRSLRGYVKKAQGVLPEKAAETAE
jgi:hypothetical protein